MLAHGGGPGMGPGLVSHDKFSWHPGVRVVVPPASAFHVNPGYGDALHTALKIGTPVAVIVGVLALPTFVIGPFIIKAFAPKWGYGRRLAASLGLGMAVGTTTMLIKTARGEK